MRVFVKICALTVCVTAVVYYLAPENLNTSGNYSLRSILGISNDRHRAAALLKQSKHISTSSLSLVLSQKSAFSKPFQGRSSPKCGYLTVELLGRLGNWMGQIASVISLSILTNREVILHDSASYLVNIFPNLVEYVSFNNTLIADGTFQGIRQATGDCCKFDPTILERMKCGFNYQLQGYYMSWRYFHNFSNEIRHAFAINSSYSAASIDRINQALQMKNLSPTSVVIIGIHNRRGDYLEQVNINNGHFACTDEYFHMAMTYRILLNKS